MKNLIKVIDNYLKKKTGHAILINGKWGVGKTYYYNEVLSKEIAKTPTLKDNSISYQPIHISMFGLKSINDLQREMFLGLNPLLKKGEIKLSLGVAKALGRGLFEFMQLGNINDYISDIKPDDGDLINFDRLVICIDDLERTSSSLPYEELIGFINNLIEYYNAKIILIANEDKIEDDKYNEYKEKIVGVTIEYLPQIEDVLDAILKSRYKAYSAYIDFLISHKKLILQYLERNENNFRTLIFALDSLHDIYSVISNEILDDSKKKDLISDEILNSLVQFSLAISMEFKNREITYTDKRELNKDNFLGTLVIPDIFTSEKKEKTLEPEKESYLNNFREKYLYNEKPGSYKYFPSIYDFITGGKEFNVENLTDDIEEKYHLKDNKVEQHYQVLDNLKVGYDLKDRVHKKLVREMLKYAEVGKYSLKEYLTIFSIATTFNNYIGYNPEKLKKRLIRGIKKCEYSQSYVNSLDFHLDTVEGKDFKSELKEIRNHILEVNRKIKLNDEGIDIDELIGKMESDWDSFYEDITSTIKHYHFTPIFENVSSYKVFVQINKLSIASLVDFRRLLDRRYLQSTNPELKGEIKFLKELAGRIEPNSKVRKRKNKKNYLLNLILKQLQTAIGKLEGL